METVAKICLAYLVQKTAICRELRDLPLVDGDPPTDIRLIWDPARKFVVATKDGTIHEHTI